MPGCTPNTGAAMTPARPASAAPGAKVEAKSRFVLTPSAPSISASLTPARVPQERRFEREAEHAERKRRGEHGEPEGAGGLDDGERDVRPEHVERAVREVDDIHHPEHEREARGENEKQGAERETVQRLLEYELGTHAGVTSPGRSPSRSCR